ncbi:MAG: YceI family protein [Phaeodactylibacter sp.]|nr:YceI family protein [Phaeodactylibacter sp.]MCB9274054.1 YceI family protein [Lewinellaceae bacterium]
MKKYLLLAVTAILAISSVHAQRYFTREGKVSFFSDTPMEKIEAHNSKATSVWDTQSGKMEFAVLIKAFQFEKALMQEHFNENYMESDKYPKATFKGAFTDTKNVNLAKDGEYPVTVKGTMEIHGVSNSLEAPGKIIVKGGKVKAMSSFEIAVADYNIEIPGVVREKIAKTVRVDVDVDYEELKK